jgi:neutral ceramidase
MTLRAGAAVVDITPAAGLLLAGFAARTEPAIGMHDPLTARAVVVGDTAIVVADVVGFHEEMSARIRERCALPADKIIVAATHTHGAPISMRGRLGAKADAQFLQQLEDGCVAAIDAALQSARPASITAGMGADPDVARNRRRDDGPLDRSVPVLRIRDEAGAFIAVIASYACHPVVLAADNQLMTADFPHYVRARLEAEHPGAVALFLNGCTGDANIGHPAQASWTLAANSARTFENAERLGNRIADAALMAAESPIGDSVAAAATDVVLDLERRENDLVALAALWREEMGDAEQVRKILLGHWVDWATKYAGTAPGNWTGRVSMLEWGGVPIVALPGEIFAETGLAIRAACGDGPAFVLSYAEGTPGYIPPASEFQHGGYEVEEAHRFIGMPGSFAPGSAERLVAAAHALLAMRKQAANPME